MVQGRRCLTHSTQQWGEHGLETAIGFSKARAMPLDDIDGADDTSSDYVLACRRTPLHVLHRPSASCPEHRLCFEDTRGSLHLESSILHLQVNLKSHAQVCIGRIEIKTNTLGILMSLHSQGIVMVNYNHQAVMAYKKVFEVE